MPNALAGSTSPYLLQHADNPVDWHEWGDAAFAAAAERDVPVLLSIGYAACHWCHVMAHESFEDPETARIMNELFVNVKVDREERPDVDALYMNAVQALTGHGGWPMTMFCAPDGTPLIGGTYFPPEPRHGMPAFRSVLAQVSSLWRERRDDLRDQGNRLLDALRRSAPPADGTPEPELVEAGAAAIVGNHDRVNGGFGAAPKFPQAPVLELGLRTASRVAGMREGIERTLTRMALGGIYDQLGGGFARYAVDATWTVPHFEKMLYDNAQLARVYTRAWQAFGQPLYRRIALETLDYLVRDMRDPAGGFHSSEDADSEGREGTYYVWSYDEVAALAPDAIEHYGVTRDGNFEGTNVLTAAGAEPPPAARRALLLAREQRERPGRDDKVLASWNGLAIGALAEAGAAFDRPDLIDAAITTATFLLDRMTDGGRLLHAFRDGRAHLPSFCEDDAFVSEGLLALYRATFDPRWLDASRDIATAAAERFGAPDGGFLSTTADDVLVRQQEIVESATPSSAGVLTSVLLGLGRCLGRDDLIDRADAALAVAKPYMAKVPQAVPTWLSALDRRHAPPREVAFTGDLSTPTGRALLSVVHGRYLPDHVVAGGDAPHVPSLSDKPPTDVATAYVCERWVCREPTSDPGRLADQLDAG